MSWIYILLLILLTSLFIRRNRLFKSGGIPVLYFQIAFLFKLVAGVCFIAIYSSYYQNREEADVFKYYDDALHIDKVRSQSTTDYFSLVTGIGDIEHLTNKYLSNSRFWDKSPSLPFLNDNRFIIRYHALLLPISAGNIYFHLTLGIILSFIGLTLLFHFFKTHFDLNKTWIFMVVFITPSIVFWTSSILKENFLFLGMGMFFYSLDIKLKSLKLILSILGLSLIAMSKIYILILLIPVVFAWKWSEHKKDGKAIWRYLISYLFFFSLLLNATVFNSSLNFLEVLSQKQSEFICLASWTGAGSQVYIPEISAQITSFLKASPFALYNTLFRPMPWDISGLLSVPAIFEILSFLLLLSFVILFFKHPKEKSKNILLLSIFFTFSLALLIGWTSPVLGAIVRYRIAFLPFLYLTLLSLVDFEKLKNKISNLKT